MPDSGKFKDLYLNPNPPKGNRGGGQRRDEGPGIGLAGT